MIWHLLTKPSNFSIIWKVFEEGLLNPKGITTFSEIFLKILLCYQKITYESDWEYAPDMNEWVNP